MDKYLSCDFNINTIIELQRHFGLIISFMCSYPLTSIDSIFESVYFMFVVDMLIFACGSFNVSVLLYFSEFPFCFDQCVFNLLLWLLPIFTMAK